MKRLTQMMIIFSMPPTPALFIPPKKLYEATSSNRIPAAAQSEIPKTTIRIWIPGRQLATVLNRMPVDDTTLVKVPEALP